MKVCEPPYTSRNGPILDLNDLLLIKGITPKLFNGSEQTPGMADYMTVYGMAMGAGTSFNWPGRININTADVPVIAALLGLENKDLAQTLSEVRQEMMADKDSQDFANPQWYQEIPGFAGVALNPNLITTSSDVFRIKSEAAVNETKTSVTAVVQRVQGTDSGKWTCKVLDWRTE